MSNPTTFRASKFRSAATAKILQTASENGLGLTAWTHHAIKDLQEGVHLKDSKNGNERRTWLAARRAVREGAELFAGMFWPCCATEESRHKAAAKYVTAYWRFIHTTVQDIVDMAELEANAE